MNPNADYLGIITAGAGARQRQRSKKNRRASDGTAWRGHHYFSLIFSLLGIAIADASWYCVLLTGGDSK